MKPITAGPITVERDVAFLHGRRLDLCRQELALLAAFANDPHRCFTNSDMACVLYDADALFGLPPDRLAMRMRARFALLAPRDQLLTNVWGVGWRLLTPERALAA